MKSDTLPECPFPAHDRDTIRDHIRTIETLETLKEELANRSFGRRIFRSMRLRNTIERTRGRATAERDYHHNLLTEENLAAYETWYEAYIDAIETKR